MRNELAFLKKLVGSDMDEEKARHYIVSSNLLYYEALWSAAKRSRGLQSFRKYFFWHRHTAPAGKHTTKGLSLSKGSQAKNKNAALVDIVAEEGSEWIRVSTVSEKRILFDLAKLGWVNDFDSDEDEDTLDARSIGVDDEDDDEDQVDVVRNARQLARAARANPIRGRPPKVRFVLTRVVAGQSAPIDSVINKIRATGAIVQCGDEIPPAPAIDDVLPHLLIDRSRALSNTLNIDCTILLALISDISHKPCPILDWYPGEVRAQIEEEAEDHLLPTHLYPAIKAHPMVCTREAADQMNLIVQTLATDTERLRADLLLGQGDWEARSSQDLVVEWVCFTSNFPLIHLTPSLSPSPLYHFAIFKTRISSGNHMVEFCTTDSEYFLGKSIRPRRPPGLRPPHNRQITQPRLPHRHPPRRRTHSSSGAGSPQQIHLPLRMGPESHDAECESWARPPD